MQHWIDLDGCIYTFINQIIYEFNVIIYILDFWIYEFNINYIYTHGRFRGNEQGGHGKNWREGNEWKELNSIDGVPY